MKFSLFAIAATLAVVNAADCDLTKVRPLLTNPDVSTCTTESGFSFVPPSKPTAEVATKVCASTACKNVLTAVKGLGLGDCTLLGLQLEADLLTPLTTACGGSAAASSNSTTAGAGGKSAGSQGAGGNNSTVTAPKPTTAAPGASSATKPVAGSNSTDAAKAPAATPTPTPTSGASSIAIASSAAVVAVAAAFL